MCWGAGEFLGGGRKESKGCDYAQQSSLLVLKETFFFFSFVFIEEERSASFSGNCSRTI